MLHLKKILVPRDFSDFSDYAFDRAVELVSEYGAELHLLYADVLHTDISTVGGGGLETSELLNKRLLEGTQQLIAEKGITVKTNIARDLASASAIVTYAIDNDIDMIVMGTHGRRGFRRLLIGSTAEEVARTSPCPVMTIRMPSEDSEAGQRKPGHIKTITAFAGIQAITIFRLVLLHHAPVAQLDRAADF